MFKEGLGDRSSFAGYHPWVNVTYYILAIGLTMVSLSPRFLPVTFLLAWFYSLLIRGRSILKLNLIMSFWSLVIMGLINVFFTHDGVTVWFYINDNAITMEAFLYGISAAVMLVSVVIWLTSFNSIISSDKLIYLFGKAAPVLGLTLSMIFRYIPLLKSRFAEIRLGQACLGRGHEQNLFGRVRQFGKEVSILISWSLESSIESADSMEARGYGLPGRRSFHLYRFQMRDGALLALMLALASVVIAAAVTGKTRMNFYPSIRLPDVDLFTLLALVAYAVLLALPAIIDITGVVRWKRSDLTM